MIEYVYNIWNSPIRIGPLVLGVILFAAISVLRHFTRFAYVPSYFIFFPMSAMNRDIANYYGERMTADPPRSVEARREAKRKLFLKSMVATVITFAGIPSFLGVIGAFFMADKEVVALISVMLVWQGYSAYQSALDNTMHASRPIASRAFFFGFYAVYLFSLASCTWFAFSFVVPYVKISDFLDLFYVVWEKSFYLFFATLSLGVLGNLVAYFITEQEIFHSEWSHEYRSDRTREEEDDV